MIDYEKNLYKKGIRYIAGIDEVGRGPLAGPMVASAVILNLERIKFMFDDDFTKSDVDDETLKIYTQIKDSKKLTHGKRQFIKDMLEKEVIEYSIVEIEHTHIDKLGISEATQLIFYETVSKLKRVPEHILTDNFDIKKITKEHQTNIVGGDNKSITVAAASILAKVYRDELMDKLHYKYPEYGFIRNKGYGTKEHLDALHKHGPCEIHRKSFEPLKSLLKKL
jgi:ribonuclease HII